MDVLSIPFNRLLGLEAAESAGFIYSLPHSDACTNHVGTTHAMAQAALAEASAGEYCFRCLPSRDSFRVLLRRMQTRFVAPARGRLNASASVTEDALATCLAALERKGKGFLMVDVEVVDIGGRATMEAEVEWYISRKP